MFVDVLDPKPGMKAVVLSNESDLDLCSWLPFAARLASAGYSPVLYNYAGPPGDDLDAITGWLSSHGAAQIALVGASEGAKASIIQAATAKNPPGALISLSAEDALMGVQVAPYAAALKVPTMFVTAASDNYGSTDATKGFQKSAREATKPLVVVPGSAHGVALLNTAMMQRLIGFLNDQLPTPTPPPPPGCADAGKGTPFWLTGPAGSTVEAESVGAGSDAVVFLHEKGMKGMCGFAAYAGWLANTKHVRAILLDFCGYGGTDCPAADPAATAPWRLTAAAVSWARVNGAHSVTLVGASAGGGDALVAASQITPTVNAVIDLSGDNGDGADMTKAARSLAMPTLYAVAPNDSFCPVSTMRALLAATPHGNGKLTLQSKSPGAHGWDLLPDGTGGWTALAQTIGSWVVGDRSVP